MIISKLNEEELKKLQQKPMVFIYRLQDTDEAVQLLLTAAYHKIESKAYGDVSLMNFKTYYWWFAAIMFILLLQNILFLK